MSSPNALLTFSIGPVHAFISQARRVADVWAGSDLLSHLMGKAIGKARSMGGETVFPAVVDDEEATGIPNRVVCRVPLEDADEIARAMGEAVDSEWRSLAGEAVEVLARHGIAPAAGLWAPEGQEGARQTDHVFESAWSWVSEEQGYAAASAEGASRYAASRLCRPFVQVEQQGEKCALCGERTALPDGDRGNVRAAWQTAADRAKGGPDERFLRFDQGRLCLVCATKRLYTRNRDSKRVYFRAFDAFDQEARGSRKNEGDAERAPYVALVNMDGDRMSEVLAWGPSGSPAAKSKSRSSIVPCRGPSVTSRPASGTKPPTSHWSDPSSTFGASRSPPRRGRAIAPSSSTPAATTSWSSALPRTPCRSRELSKLITSSPSRRSRSSSRTPAPSGS